MTAAVIHRPRRAATPREDVVRAACDAILRRLERNPQERTVRVFIDLDKGEWDLTGAERGALETGPRSR